MSNRNIVIASGDGQWSVLRGVLAYLIMGFLVSLQFIMQGSVSLMVPELKADLGLDEAAVGLISSLYFYPYVLLQIPCGWLISHLGIRRLLMLAGVVMCAGCLIQANAQTASVMLLGRLVAGMGASPIIVCFLGTVELCFVATLFGALAASMEMFGMLGACVGDFILPNSITLNGWRSVLQNFALLSLVPIIFAPLLPRRRSCKVDQRDCQLQWSVVFGDMRVWIVAIYSGLMFAVINAFGALWAIPWLESTPHCMDQAGQMVGMTFLGAALGAPLLGWLIDNGLSSRWTMVVCALVTVLLLVFLLTVPLPTLAYYPLLFILGLLVSAYVLPFVLVKQWLKGDNRALGMAFTNTVSVMIGALFFQPVIGWLVSHFGEVSAQVYQQVLMVIPAGVGIGALLVLLMDTQAPNPVAVASETDH